ncbi:hypothetical protein BBK36DRAFT_1165863 [Trichoderma citrinoviride]|uniref:Glucan 1, 4-alpha-glucosidase n=1 Tax=Trichoderma citrinoviride TaxID=58853 RepID=A0A2T4BK21_9HYPO|nr:hypothetical protein BBK36DRAFT_1165863 [Trichoderma citrinoviride]PTB69611.1 hypothetical protein BBK36DRAFT_1165863 [Trichoderma citrinoviride]
MEDPWGSPWAVDSSPARIELPSAPQNAHFSADHLFPRRGSRSPAPPSRSRSPAGWEDDEAWGGWNGGAASDGGGGGSGKESPGWGRSPGLKPVQVAPSVRSLSPDPWKEVALKRLDTTAALENDEEREPRARRASETSGDDRAVDSAISLGEEQGLQRGKQLKSDIVPLVVPPLEIDAAEGAWDAEVAPEAPAVDAVIPAIQLEQPDFAPDTGLSPVLDVVCGEEKHEISTAADDILREEEANIVPGSFEVEDQQRPTAAVEVMGNAAEDAAIVIEPVISQPLPTEAELAAESQAWQQESEVKISKAPAVSEVDSLGVPAPTFPDETVERSPSRASNKPTLHFPIDLTLLDDLFPDTPPITTEPELVPDVIIDDTFASGSERRAWYLISRFGSMRKHDMGDDDNYVRVGWAGSQIREQTTQTVRRWMEEDSITGRVVLGRRLGGSGAAMFNWNSSAPPVEIGEFLGRHSRNSSMTVHSAAESPTASSFGWNSSVPSSPAASRHPLANEVPQEDAREVPSPKETKADPALQSLSLAPPPLHNTRAHIPTPIHIPPTYSIHQDEDDDDWGEMMTATPTTTMSFTEDEETTSKRYSVPPQSAFQFDTVVDSLKPVPPKTDKAPSKRPFSWHLGQTLSKPFRRGPKTPSTPSFPSPLSKPLTPPQVAQAATPRHGHNVSASVSFIQPAERPNLSAEEEETVAKLLGDIPDLTYMLR